MIQELRIYRLHRASVRKAAHLALEFHKLHIGCGPNLKAGWINVDLSDEADLRLDVREALPFATGSIEMVYSEHFFEHLEYPDEALGFLNESYRVLQPGGLFSVGVPDTEWPLQSYVNNEQEYFDEVRTHWHPAWCDTPMHHLNFHFRQGKAHKYAYDFETLAKILDSAGFVSIKRRSFDDGLDDERRQRGTLYVDAIKPDPGP